MPMQPSEFAYRRVWYGFWFLVNVVFGVLSLYVATFLYDANTAVRGPERDWTYFAIMLGAGLLLLAAGLRSARRVLDRIPKLILDAKGIQGPWLSRCIEWHEIAGVSLSEKQNYFMRTADLTIELKDGEPVELEVHGLDYEKLYDAMRTELDDLA
jgi:hypothetical protein